MTFEQKLAARLDERKKANRFRTRRVLQSAQKNEVFVDGQHLVNFCSNDYLGLANHPELIAASASATERYGFGGGASHLVCGHSQEHHLLEEELAEFTGRDRALLFSTGYMANLGVIQALASRGDEIFEDKLNHASLIDGAQLSRSKFKRYRHLDMQQLDSLLLNSAAQQKLVVSDAVFSMDGDTAPLVELAEIAQKNHAVLMADDAHGFGCLGPNGAGLQEQLGLDQAQLPILMCTLGKAVGSFGAFVAGSEQLIETLVQFARSYIYTTSMPPSVAAASRAGLKLLQSESWRREKLSSVVQHFKSLCEQEGVNLMPSDTAIQPVLVGGEAEAVFLSEYLFENKFWVTAIRPPTVPEGSSRLRVTLTASHENEQVEALVSTLAQGLKKLDTGAWFE